MYEIITADFTCPANSSQQIDQPIDSSGVVVSVGWQLADNSNTFFTVCQLFVNSPTDAVIQVVNVSDVDVAWTMSLVAFFSDEAKAASARAAGLPQAKITSAPISKSKL
jgi:predicted carbohydrate-binding protein with CBM5 and CBM33 domain